MTGLALAAVWGLWMYGILWCTEQTPTIQPDDYNRLFGYHRWRTGYYVTSGQDQVSLKDSSELPEGAGRAVAEVSQAATKAGGSVRFKLYDKVGVLEKIGRHLGMFPNCHEVGGFDGHPINFTLDIDRPSDDDDLALPGQG